MVKRRVCVGMMVVNMYMYLLSKSLLNSKTIRCGLRRFWSWHASKPRYPSRLVVFDLGDLATKPVEIPGGEMPDDFNPGRDAHPTHLSILVALTRPGCEQIAPMLFLKAVRRQMGQLALLIHMQHHRSRHVLLAYSSLDRVSIDGFPLDGIRQPGGREPDHFSQVALQLTLIHF